jgi:hypothetical protein
MSPLLNRKPAAEPKAATGNLPRQPRRGIAEVLTPLRLHIAGVAVLGLVCVYLLVQVGLLWQTANSSNTEALAQQRMLLQAAKISARPLEGLDAKLEQSSRQADQFEHERLPVAYSEFVAQLGVVADRNHVRLTRVQYAPKAVIGAVGKQLTEVQMDASLSGDYRSLIGFLNGLERDKQFFLIDNLSLTGQQTGQVNLRMRLTTYLLGVPPAELEQQVSDDAADATGASSQLALAQKGGGAR